MLKIGLERGDWREIRGQVVRLIAVVPGDIFGWVPQGNTGGANVSALRSMPIPKDLRLLLEGHSLVRDAVARVFVAVLLISLGTLLAGNGSG